MLIFEKQGNGGINLIDHHTVLMEGLDLWTVRKLQQLLCILGKDYKEEYNETIQKVFNKAKPSG